MQNFVRLAQGIDVQPLLLALHQQPALFDPHSFRSTMEGSPHVYAATVVLRCQPTDGSLSDPRECIWHPAIHLLPQARPLIYGLAAQVGCERLGRCLITRLEYPNAIFPHSDVGTDPGHYERTNYWSRFHVVLASDPAALFRVEDEVVHMQAGEVWWFAAEREHEVFWHNPDNAPTQSRVHLIVDCHTERNPVVEWGKDAPCP